MAQLFVRTYSGTGRKFSLCQDTTKANSSDVIEAILFRRKFVLACISAEVNPDTFNLLPSLARLAVNAISHLPLLSGVNTFSRIFRISDMQTFPSSQ